MTPTALAPQAVQAVHVAPSEQPEQDEESTRPKSFISAALSHPLFDYHLVIAASAVLLCLGLLMVISSSSVIAAAQTGNPYYFGERQLVFAVVGLLGATVLGVMPEKLLKGLSLPAMLAAVVLIILTFTPLGVSVAGNNNWVSFGPSWTQFQPSEFAKLAIILWGAKDLAARRKHLNDMRQWFVYIIASFSIVALVVLQKDQGTAMVMAAMVILVLIAAGAPWRLLFGLIGVAAAGIVGLIIIQPYRMDRIWAFLNPDTDPLGMNLQPRRSIYALASGGWFGQGLGASRQKWGLLAEAHTDYIFAIIGEELGLLGTLTVIALFVALAWAGIRIASKSSPFYRLVAIGVVAWFSVQAFVNIAVAVRAIPVMGVTLPMISYGGSSLMANLFAVGLLAGCARHEPEAQRVFLSRKHRPRIRAIVRENA